MHGKKREKRPGRKADNVAAVAVAVAAGAVVEALEQRQLLSVSATTLAGPYLTKGATFVYTITSSAAPGSATDTQTVVGPATAPTGQAAIERDITIVGTANNGTTVTSTSKQYYGATSNEIVEFATVDTATNGDVETRSYSPPQLSGDATLSAGVPFSTSSTETDVTVQSGMQSTSTSTRDETYTLVSETPSPVTVPAGTFSAYEVTGTETVTSDGTTNPATTSDYFFSPKAGLIKLVVDSGAGGTTTSVLTSFNTPGDHLVFSTSPPQSVQIKQTIKPAAVVEAEGNDNQVDTNASGSVTLALATVTGDGTLSGTVTEPYVNGVATFSDLSVSDSGTYQLQATDGNSSTAATSASFEVSADHLVFTKEPTSGDIKEPIDFTVTAYTPKNKVDTSATGDVSVSLDVVEGGSGATLKGTTTVALAGGRATFTATDDDNVAVSGTYELSANLAGSDEASPAIGPDAQLVHPNAANSFFNGISKPFTLSGFQLVFKKDIPAKDDPNAPIGFTVALEDKKHKIVTVDDGNFVSVTDATQIGEGEGTAFNYIAPYAKLEGGIADFPTDNAGLSFTTPERYAIRVQEASAIGMSNNDDTLVDSTNGALSKVFTIEPLQLVFAPQPSTEVTGDPVSFKVEVQDYKHDVVHTEDANEIDISTVFQIVPVQEGIAIFGSVAIVNGVGTFSGSTGVIFNQAGTYFLQVKEASAAATESQPIQYVTYTNSAKSKIFRVIT